VPRVDVGAAGVVVVGGGRYGADVRGVALRDGKEVWVADADNHELGVSSALVFTAVGERPNSVLRASSRRTGKEEFTFPTAPDGAWTETFDVVAADAETVVVANGGYSGRRGSDPLGPTTFFVLDAHTGEERSRFESADPRLLFSGLAMGHGLLVYSERGSIVARALDDGSTIWRRSFHGERPLISASTSDRVVVATADHTLRSLDLRTGAHRWRVSNSLVRAYDERTAIVIRTTGTDRGLRAVDMESGDVRWSRQLPGSLPGNVSQVAFAVDGDTVVLTDACDLG
jgi:outer membrane protein assembly factor BamB